jgi:transglutaminase-like putative cysteine protease
MLISIRHSTTYTYEPPIERCTLRLRLYPSSFASQRIQSWRVEVNGAAVEPLLTTPCGGGESLWATQTSCDRVEVTAIGLVETGNSAGVVRGARENIRPGVYRRTTHLTAPDAAIEGLAKKVGDSQPLDRMHTLSGLVRDAIDYTPGTTDTGTTAGQALRRGAGVCQDHAHVFISAARVLGFPARYVVGYLLAESHEQLETHAWAEAYVPDLGWVGFDAANRLCPTERYVRLTCGFDADDAAPLRGNHSGGGKESLSARVDMVQTQQ